MNIDSKTQYGAINLSSEAIASVAGKAAAESYGVVGLAARPSLSSLFTGLLKIDEYEKGIYVSKSAKGYSISVYVYVAFGVRVTEVVSEIQKRVKYLSEKTFDIKLSAVNVYVQDVKDI
ncbi:MAG: Asp23/Gls24 family envelope stress response protein [Bacillota bacterium]|nr:Asp23/Gls24 family envelope stress response protein [Bacillota bacterium]